MNERQRLLIEMFHDTHSLVQTCREDQSVMLEQHKLGALLEDRILESARRMDAVLKAIPHMVAVLEAISTDEELGRTADEEEVVAEPELVEVPEPETVADFPPDDALDVPSEPGDVPDAPNEPDLFGEPDDA